MIIGIRARKKKFKQRLRNIISQMLPGNRHIVNDLDNEEGENYVDTNTWLDAGECR